MLIEALVLLLTIYVLWMLWFKVNETPGLPGPTPIPLFGNLLQFFSPDSSIAIVKFREQYGKMYRLWISGRKVLFICKPECIKHCMVTNAKNYMARRVRWTDASLRVEDRKNIFDDVDNDGVSGVLFSNGDRHKLHRKVAIENMLRGEMLRKFADSIIDYTDRLSERWVDLSAKSEVCLNVIPEFKNVTMDIIGKAAFNFEFNSIKSGYHEISDALVSIMELLDKHGVWFVLMDRIKLLRWIPGSPTHLVFKHGATLKKWLSKIISEKVKKIQAAEAQAESSLDSECVQADEVDFLDSLLHFRTDDNGKLNNTDILADVFDMFAAGHETTATTLSWCVFFLGKNPQFMANIREEMERVLAGRLRLAYDDIKALEYTEAFIKETLRISPIVPLVNRVVAEDDVIGGIPVKKGDTVVLNFVSIMKDSDYWSNPLTFDPLRFMDPTNNEANNRFTFMPFGVGPRTCVGIGLAMLEAKVILATLVQRFTFRLHESNLEYKPSTSITTAPANLSMKAYISPVVNK